MPVQGSTQQMEMGMKIIMPNKCFPFFLLIFVDCLFFIFLLCTPENVAVSILSLAAKKNTWNDALLESNPQRAAYCCDTLTVPLGTIGLLLMMNN